MAVLRLVLVLLWAGAAVSSVVDLQKRVIGGQACLPGERPYHVRVENNGGFCGGSFIPGGWILTAAHCWDQRTNIDVIFGVNSGQEQTIGISKPPKIYEDKTQNDHDLMLLKLPDFAQIPAGVTPIRLHDCKNQPGLGDNVKIAGQGSTIMGPNKKRQPGYTPVLQCAEIPVVDCATYFSRRYEHRFCGFNGNVDLCLGDSGGGAVHNNMLYGVFVRVGHKDYACTRQAAFMNICHKDYMKWIKNTVNPSSNPLNCFKCG